MTSKKLDIPKRTIKDTGGHNYHVCSSTCDGCQFCEGGLAFCTICRGGEASLPAECPGRNMSQDEQSLVQAGLLDYKNGDWRYSDKYVRIV